MTIKILKTDTCPSISGKSTLKYQIGADADDAIHLRITGSSGGGFFSNDDRRRMERILATPPEALAAVPPVFDDQRLPEMLFRYRARNYPETLSADEQAQWLEHCHARLVDGESGHFTFTDFHAELEQLRGEMAVEDQGNKLLDDVAAFGAE